MLGLMLVALLSGAQDAAPDPADRQPVIQKPDWIGKPDGSAVNRYYPALAQQLEVGGRLKLRCTVTETGHVTDCKVEDETPSGLGFGDAAISLSQYFQMNSTTADGTPVAGASVLIPIAFSPAEEPHSAPPPRFYRTALGCVTWNRVRLDILGENTTTTASLGEAKRHARELGAAEGVATATVEADLAKADIGGEPERARMADLQANGRRCMFVGG